MITAQNKSPVIGIVEDEILIADNLVMHLKDFGYRVLPSAASYERALGMIELGRPDLVLVDIRLIGKRTGIDLGKYLNEQKIPFIYITAQYDEATLKKAAETVSAGFITKPYTPENINAMIGLALLNTQKHKNELVELPDGHSIIKLEKSEILYLESEHIYVQVATTDRKILVRRPLKELVQQLGEQFRQVHKSYAVNVSKISRIESAALWIGMNKIPIGRVFRDALRQDFPG